MINITLSFSEFLLRKIDNTRGDVSRSRFISKLVEIGYQNLGNQSKPLQQQEFRKDPQEISAAKGVKI
jgi:metal-responsive CopG/Arc/MetJ family transcriptional regulator